MADTAVGPDHHLQLFDEAESRAGAVAAFVLEGERRGERILLALAPENRVRLEERLREAGYPLAARLAAERLVIFDANAMRRLLLHRDRPDAALFDELVGGIVRRLDGDTGLRVYGEIVDVLAAEGNFRGAIALEQLWNALARQHRFTLLCGYSAVHFGNPRSQDSLRQICRAHSRVHADAADDLAAWLLQQQARAFGPI
jgi:hypothetical protein